MVLSQKMALLIFCILLVLVQGDDTNDISKFNDNTPLQLIDITELLKSLNITYEDILLNQTTDVSSQKQQNSNQNSSNQIQHNNNQNQWNSSVNQKSGSAKENIGLQPIQYSSLKNEKNQGKQEKIVEPSSISPKSIYVEDKSTELDSNKVKDSSQQIIPATKINNTKTQAKSSLKENQLQVPLSKNPQKQNSQAKTNKIIQNSFQVDQYDNRYSSTIYSISASYKIFSNYFIITQKDPYLQQIKDYLMDNYGNYLQSAQIIAGFKIYNYYGDNCIDYQLLYQTMYGTFITILTYWGDTNYLQLKSLSIINFYAMQTDYSNCFQRNIEKQNCKICIKGYRNFMGRCQLIDQYCLKYITDECGTCIQGKILSQGHCK